MSLLLLLLLFLLLEVSSYYWVLLLLPLLLLETYMIHSKIAQEELPRTPVHLLLLLCGGRDVNVSYG